MKTTNREKTPNPPTVEDLWDKWMRSVPEKLRCEDGIRAQFGAAAALVMFFATEGRGSDYMFLPTEVGGEDDRLLGYDGYIVHKKEGYAYAVDFSLEAAGNPRGNKAGVKILVHLSRDWFIQRPDGIWELNPRSLNSLVRAIAPALAAGPSPLRRNWSELASLALAL